MRQRQNQDMGQENVSSLLRHDGEDRRERVLDIGWVTAIMDIYKGETEIIPLVCVITNTRHKIGCAQLAKKRRSAKISELQKM